MTINATVLRVFDDRLLVRDLSNNEEIMVNFRNARRFSPGDFVKITFNGQMTPSIPPQIAATSIQRIERPVTPPPSTSSELRAVVIQKRRGSLLVREMNTNNQFIVEYRQACSFRVGQRIVVQYETIFLNVPPNPSRIIATNITPVIR